MAKKPFTPASSMEKMIYAKAVENAERIDKIEKEAVEVRQRLDSISDYLGEAADTKMNVPSPILKDFHLRSKKEHRIVTGAECDKKSMKGAISIELRIDHIEEMLDDIDTLEKAAADFRRAFLDEQNTLCEIEEACEEAGYDPESGEPIKDWIAKIRDCLVLHFKKE